MVQSPKSLSEEAPYGFKADGTPYKRDPNAYKNRVPRGSKTSASNKTQERAQRLYEFVNVPVTIIGIAGQTIQSKPLVADAVVLRNASAPLASAVADLADQDERIAQIVDSLAATGPYAALFGVLLPVTVQIASNHSDRFAKIGKFLGAQTVDQILDGFIEEGDNDSTGDSAA